MKKLLYLFLLFIVLSGCSNTSAQKNDEDELRKEFTLSFFKDAENIARESGSKMAADLIRALKNSALLCKTNGTNLNIILDNDFYEELYDESITQNRNFTFYFVPLIKENGDMNLDIGGQKIDMSKQAGFCNTSPLSLYVTDNFSKIFQTALIVHEGMHVYQSANSVYEEIVDEDIKRVMIEYDAYTIESELLRGLGGELYLGLLELLSGKIYGANQRGELFTPLDVKKYLSDLEQVFGPSNTEVEANMRISIVWIDSYFYLIENRLGMTEQEAEDSKKNFLYELFKNGTMY